VVPARTSQRYPYGYAATSDGNGMRIGQANQLAVRPATRSSPVGYEIHPARRALKRSLKRNL
jgi:hypothetical protein